ncbi:uncharacterized protein LOC111692996 [Anoplophora glabripennis]|uniref:uncharacterized protein LOC111692996 n=1 Tax=Anoplophora glabripennis TaxID=217634 RepID=UPI000C775FBE|nr:uncharacterized protein LOC111692996 [Anoplophora glabripennis]
MINLETISSQGSISDKVRMFVIIFTMVAEFFMVYGLPAQLLMDESAAIADTVYSECKWYSSKLQHIWKDFFIVIIRSQRSVCIRAGNYHIINNATVLLMVKSAYTFYAFLQKVT